VSAGAGFRVTLSTPGERPDPTEKGLFVAPGSEVDIGFRLQTVHRQPPPYVSKCWDSWDTTPFKPLFFDIETGQHHPIVEYLYDVSLVCCPFSDVLANSTLKRSQIVQ
jgi:hypothetical protein